MASDREQVMVAVVSLVEGALPAADVARNRSQPLRVGAGGAVTVEDGEPGEPEVDVGLGEPIYTYAHAIPVLFTAATWAALDTMMRAVGDAVKADRFLGGRVDYLEAQAPAVDPMAVLGAEDTAKAEAMLVAHYATRSPL